MLYKYQLCCAQISYSGEKKKKKKKKRIMGVESFQFDSSSDSSLKVKDKMLRKHSEKKF